MEGIANNTPDLEINASDGIDIQEKTTMIDAMNNLQKKKEIIKKLEEAAAKLEPNEIKKALENVINELSKTPNISEEEINKIIEAYNLLFGKNTEGVEKTPTVDNVLWIKNKELDITWEKAYQLQQMFSSIWFQEFAKDSTEDNKKALIQAFTEKELTFVTFEPQSQLTIINFKKDVLVLDQEERKELTKIMKDGNPEAVTEFLNAQFKETIASSELLGTLDKAHPLFEKHELVNNIDNAIVNSLESEFPNMSADILRNMATWYTIAMLDYVGKLSPDKQITLAKDLEPKGKNLVEWVLNMFKKLSVNEDAGEFFTKYNNFNEAIRTAIPKEDMKDESELRKYAILGNTTEFVKAFQADEIPEITKGGEESATDSKELIALLNTGDATNPGIKTLSPKAVEAMDTLAKGLNSPGKEIHDIKDMLESGDYTDTIEFLMKIPLLKSLIEMGMKLLWYENGVQWYLDKMDDKNLKETSEFIIKDLSADKRLSNWIFKDITWIVTKWTDNKENILLHRWFSEGMKNLGKDFEDKDELVTFLNGDNLNTFIVDMKGIDNKKINPAYLKIAKEVVNNDKKINLSNLSTLVKIYSEFTNENEKLQEKGGTGIDLGKFLEKKYPVKKKESEKQESAGANQQKSDTTTENTATLPQNIELQSNH